MSATTSLLVLGAVHLLQPVHGDDVRRELVQHDLGTGAVALRDPAADDAGAALAIPAVAGEPVQPPRRWRARGVSRRSSATRRSRSA
jgi:hypothetical protein